LNKKTYFLHYLHYGCCCRKAFGSVIERL
jgi:hypothetical protein